MEARMTALERSMERVTSKVDSLGERMARIEGEISRLPGYPGLIVVLGAFVALISAVVGVGGFLLGAP